MSSDQVDLVVIGAGLAGMIGALLAADLRAATRLGSGLANTPGRSKFLMSTQ